MTAYFIRKLAEYLVRVSIGAVKNPIIGAMILLWAWWMNLYIKEYWDSVD